MTRFLQFLERCYNALFNPIDISTPEAAKAAAQRNDLDIETIILLRQHENWQVRSALAQNPFVQDELTLCTLAKDKEQAVRFSLAATRDTLPLSCIGILLDDRVPLIREYAADMHKPLESRLFTRSRA